MNSDTIKIYLENLASFDLEDFTLTEAKSELEVLEATLNGIKDENSTEYIELFEKALSFYKRLCLIVYVLERKICPKCLTHCSSVTLNVSCPNDGW